MSHIGGHLADYAFGELYARAGKPPSRYTVVPNGVYKFLWHKLKGSIAHDVNINSIDEWSESC